MVTNMSASWGTSIIISGRAISGCSATPSGWIVFMAGKVVIRIGGTTPFAMTITGLIGTAMFSPGMTHGQGKAGRKSPEGAHGVTRLAMGMMKRLAMGKPRAVDSAVPAGLMADAEARSQKCPPRLSGVHPMVNRIHMGVAFVYEDSHCQPSQRHPW
jgi:hypothetical protein